MFFILVLTQSCNDGKEQLKKAIAKLHEHPICLPLEQFVCISDKEPYVAKTDDCRSRLKVVSYSDSIVCSSCRMRNMYKWEAVLSKLERYPIQADLCLIFAPSGKNLSQFKLLAKTLPQRYPIYVDTANIFLKFNPHIPLNPAFHTFLLDENNNLLLGGNPLENEEIEKLFWQIVEEKSGKRE